MRKVLTAAEMREVDRLTTERFGIPSILLMENAAQAVTKAVLRALGGSISGRSVFILCGKGNNGGDGAAVARQLVQAGANVSVCLFGKVEGTKGDARSNFDIIAKLSQTTGSEAARLTFAEVETAEQLDVFLKRFERESPAIIVDAMFGTGLTKPLTGIHEEAVKWINEIGEPRPKVLSVDLSSGLDADRADLIGEAIKADQTVTFTAPKAANVLPPAARYNGELTVANIGSPDELIAELPSQLLLAERNDADEWLQKSRFSDDSYKNKRGHVLIVAGSENYSGAAVLCGNASIRSGVGLVTVATPRSSKDSIAARVTPEVMVRPLDETDDGAVSAEAIEEVKRFLKNVDAIAIGSGLSASSDSTAEFVKHFVADRRMPTILDADALTLISPFKNVPNSENPLIVTPHEGEFLKMLGTEDKAAVSDRVGVVREFSQKHNVILVLKGERVLIGEPGGRVVVNPTGNAGLGKAGNGDTLMGLLAGFVAQAAKMGIDIFETVTAAVYIAGLAGDFAEKKYGKRVMTASDVRECLAEVFEQLESTGK
jgi:ADP-dependent NAD(P)H-hydrate dehydratase / NAD(P)H-hydrate epimerase